MSSQPPAPVAEVARILARLSHRFADREAILWRAGYDEASWTTLEAEATRALLAEADRGDAKAIVAFARALLEARAALLFANDRESTDNDTATTIPRARTANAFADHETTTSEGNSPFVEPLPPPPPPLPKPHLGTTMPSYAPILDKPRR
ncbi:MAG: hypothetical protein U0414_30640 [Polyangiaceae bacterium]